MATLDKVRRDALRLALQDRARLTEELLESMDPRNESEIEGLWLDEAERRLQAYREGGVQSIPADEVLKEAEDSIR